MFVRNCWYVAGWSHDLAQGERLALRIAGTPLLFYRKQDSSIVALEDRCAHRHAPLSLGRCEGDNIRCMYHGLLFSPEGQCLEIPGQTIIPERMAIKPYPVVEKDSWIWVWMGEQEADETLIPASHGLDDPDWHLSTGYLDYDANYQLISDNLTDFSHLSFVHANSFKAGLNWALSQPKISLLDRGIRVRRWVMDDPVPPYLGGEGLNSVDQLVEYDYMAPGVLLLSTEIHPGGAERELDAEPSTSSLFATFSAQAVTPMDEKRTRYFFSWGPSSRNGTREDANVMMKVALQAFGEDKLIIEEQQKIIDARPPAPAIPIAADKGVVMFQGVMKKLIAAEAA